MKAIVVGWEILEPTQEGGGGGICCVIVFNLPWSTPTRNAKTSNVADQFRSTMDSVPMSLASPTLALTLVCDAVNMSAYAAEARQALTLLGAQPRPIDWLAPGNACDIVFNATGDDPEGTLAEAKVRSVLDDLPVDLAVQPTIGRRKRLLVADMDSTIVVGETLDELATLAGVGDQVVPITRRAMNGEIGFAEALRERVGLLGGKPAGLLDDALAGVTLMAGARALVQTMAASGSTAVLVTGGFHFFADVIASRCGFSAVEANTLDVSDRILTGTVSGPIVGKERKLAALQEWTQKRSLAPPETLAVGDGANDLPMLQAAGLGVAYHAKPTVRTQIRTRVDHGDLTALLYFQGYRRTDFIE